MHWLNFCLKRGIGGGKTPSPRTRGEVGPDYAAAWVPPRDYAVWCAAARRAAMHLLELWLRVGDDAVCRVRGLRVGATLWHDSGFRFGGTGVARVPHGRRMLSDGVPIPGLA